MTKTFLRAQWRKLIMANYAIDSRLLLPYLPTKTEIDLWNDTCYISLVGFMFLETRLKGFRIPFHVNFEEVNLRFYVRYRDRDDWRRGVVFIKEIVPKPALTFVANAIYGENYETMAMKHSWIASPGSLTVAYQWRKGRWNLFSVTAADVPSTVTPGSEEEFITEHYWGYTRIDDRTTSEYGVEHPKWQVYPTSDYTVNVDFANVYGHAFGFLKDEKPGSVFLAEGSPVEVKAGRRL